MNEIVRQALESHLRFEAASLEEELSQALDVVQRYTSRDLERDIAEFAHAEISEEEPLRTSRATFGEDRFGVRDAFVRALE